MDAKERARRFREHQVLVSKVVKQQEDKKKKRRQKNFVFQGTLDTIAQSRRARLNVRA